MGNATRTGGALARLIALSASAIHLVQEGHRDSSQIADLLEALQAFKEGRVDPYLNRPALRPNQVLCLCQLRPGTTIHEHYTSRYEICCMVLSFPYVKFLGGKPTWWITVQYPDKSTQSISLADSGVVPYTDGMWNDSSWLSFDGQPDLHSRNCRYFHFQKK